MRGQALTVLALLCVVGCQEPSENLPAGRPAGSAPEAVASETASEGPRRVRLAQLFVSEARTEAELREEFRAIRGTGANVVAIRAFHRRGDAYHRLAPKGAPEEGIYFQSVGSPLVADLLPAFVRAAHAEDLQVWAWMTSRYCTWLLEDLPDSAEYRSVGHELERGPVLDVFHPEAMLALEKLYRDLGASGVDGVLFQDDLVLRGGDGFGPQAVRVLGPEAMEPGELRDRLWYERRARHLVWLAGMLGAAAQRGAGGPVQVAWNVYYDELWVPDKALEWLSRDVSLAGEAGFDYLVVMAYHRQVGRELGLEGEELREALGAMARRLEAEVRHAPSQAVVKLQAVDWRTGEAVPVEELRWAAEPWLEVAPFSVGVARIEALERFRFEDLEPEAATP